MSSSFSEPEAFELATGKKTKRLEAICVTIRHAELTRKLEVEAGG